MNWIQENNATVGVSGGGENDEDSSMDENSKLFSDFHALKNYLQLPKENFLFLEPNDAIAGLRSACFVQWLIENLDFEDINIILWASTNMAHTTESGPWTRTIYQDNADKMLTAVGEFATHLKIPTENVHFMVPGDEFSKEKMGEFVSNILEKFKWSNPTAVAWFKCIDRTHPRTIKRMLL